MKCCFSCQLKLVSAILLITASCSAEELTIDSDSLTATNTDTRNAHHSITNGSTVGSSAMSMHMPSMELVSLDRVTHTATSSGNWSDTSSWQGANIPHTWSRVHIPEGIIITVDGIIEAPVKTLRIDGSLSFVTDRDSRLTVDTLVTTVTGELVVGSPQQPVEPGASAQILFADDGPIDRQQDRALIGRGLLLHGKTIMHGAQKAAFAVTETSPRAGDQQLYLKNNPAGWQVGDTIVVAGTDPSNPTSDETVVITSVNGAVVGIDKPLEKNHLPAREGLDVHVANLTRNVRISSISTDIRRRGHVMVMHNNDALINYVWFNDLGRVDKTRPLDDLEFTELHPTNPPANLGGDHVRGRYSLHFHKGGTNQSDGPAKVHGSVVTNDPGWGFVNHSSYVDFSSNVTHNIQGAAYYTEGGDEIGSFLNNIAIRTVNPTDPLNSEDEVDPDSRELRQDYGFQGDGFWFHGPNVRVEGNVVSGASGHAYIWWPEGVLEKASDGSTIKVHHDAGNIANGALIGPAGTPVEIFDVPMGRFDSNQAYSTTRGIQIYYLHTQFFGDGVHLEDGVPVPPAEYYRQLRSTLTNSTLWNIEQTAVDIPYANRVTLDNLTLIGHGAPNTIGVDAAHFQNLDGIELKNLTVENFAVGMMVTDVGAVQIEGGVFYNQTDIQYVTPSEDEGEAGELEQDVDERPEEDVEEIEFAEGEITSEGEVFFEDDEMMEDEDRPDSEDFFEGEEMLEEIFEDEESMDDEDWPENEDLFEDEEWAEDDEFLDEDFEDD